MHDEADFLRKLLENPADDTVRFVYADWLDERDDEESKAKAKFLRATAQLMEPIQSSAWREQRQNELQQLSEQLPTDWLAVVSRLKVEKCAGKRASLGMTEFFNFVCDKRWDEMSATADVTIRHCDQCQENVHYCDTIVTARKHARKGHCVAIDLGIIRRDNDISSFQMKMVGRPSAADLAEERKRNEIDGVSQEREERKRSQSTEGG